MLVVSIEEKKDKKKSKTKKKKEFDGRSRFNNYWIEDRNHAATTSTNIDCIYTMYTFLIPHY